MTNLLWYYTMLCSYSKTQQGVLLSFYKLKTVRASTFGVKVHIDISLQNPPPMASTLAMGGLCLNLFMIAKIKHPPPLPQQKSWLHHWV